MKNLPQDVINLIKILKKYYPNNNIKDKYFPLIKYLYNELCDEHLIIVIGSITNKPLYMIENDIYQIASMNIDITDISNKLNIDFDKL